MNPNRLTTTSPLTDRQLAERRAIETQLDTEEMHRAIGRTGLKRLLNPMNFVRIARITKRQATGEYDPTLAVPAPRRPLEEPTALEEAREKRALDKAREAQGPSRADILFDPVREDEEDAKYRAQLEAEHARRRNPFADD